MAKDKAVKDVAVTGTDNIRKPLQDKLSEFKKLIDVSDAKAGEYKGNDLLILRASSRFPFQFGVGKAKLMIENIELIKAWVACHDTEQK